MNKEESLALFAKGQEAWNEWAEGMIAERKALEEAGDWVEGLIERRWNDATRDWHEAAAADFSNHEFEDGADFNGLLFLGYVKFDKATFSGDAWFYESTFSGDAWFSEARFSGGAEFEKATFSGGAWFNEATFSDYTSFNEATFSGYARFNETTFSGGAGFSEATFSGGAGFNEATFSDYAGFYEVTFSGYAGFKEATFYGDAGFIQTVFEGRTVFDAAEFENEANFHAMRGTVSFSLKDVQFGAVPDFIEAHFEEAPRLDNVDVEPIYKGDPDLSARWRALKRLAVQGLDHEREQVFFKGELQSRRWHEDKPRHAKFWFGWMYQGLSDFGRSAVRPLLFWLAGVTGFGLYYLGEAATLAGKSALGFLGTANGAPLSCIAGQGDPVLAALQLSLSKGLLFLGLDSTGKLNQIYACLYGVHGKTVTTAGALKPSFVPVIPDGVALLSLLQLVISAILIFLVLLALRNYFRIK